MPTEVSRRTVQLVDAANVDVTLVTFSDGSVGVLSGGDGAGGAAVSGALTDRSGTITTGGVAQNAMAANTARKYARLKNPITATEDLYFSFTGTASASSDSLPAGYEAVSRSFVPTGALSIYAATTGHAFVAEEG